MHRRKNDDSKKANCYELFSRQDERRRLRRPVDTNSSDLAIEKYIERRRAEFHREWDVYLEGFAEDYFF